MARVFLFVLFLVGSENIGGSTNLRVAKGNPGVQGPYFQGDIISIAPSLLLQERSGILEEQARWPNATVPYEFETGYPSSWKDTFLKAIQHISMRTCVKFVPRTDQRDFIKVISGEGCAAVVGRVNGKQIVSLPEDCVTLEIIVHELMHSIGFFHEHSRTDRDQYVRIHLENVKPGQNHNFKKFSEQMVTSFGIEYDYESLMHYGTNFFSKNGKDTITTIPPGIPIGQAKEMSPKDILKVNTMYKCNMI